MILRESGSANRPRVNEIFHLRTVARGYTIFSIEKVRNHASHDKMAFYTVWPHDGLHGWPPGACHPAFQLFPASKHSLWKTITRKNTVLDDLRLLIQGNAQLVKAEVEPNILKMFLVVCRKLKTYDHLFGPTCSFAYFRGMCFLYAKNSISASDSSQMRISDGACVCECNFTHRIIILINLLDHHHMPCSVQYLFFFSLTGTNPIRPSSVVCNWLRIHVHSH